jgi:hypothetical protein
MTKLRLIGAAVLALAISGPATARVYVRNSELPTAGYYHGPGRHVMRAQDFDHFNFGIAEPTYPSGWGGPYGDGQYPASIDRNMGPPYWGRY